MPTVGSTLGDQLNLRARRAPFIGVRVRGSYAEFFDRIQGGAHGSLKGKAVFLIVVVDAVECDIGLVAAASVNGAAAGIGHGVNRSALGRTCIGDTGLQTQHLDGVAAFEGEFLN